MSMEQFEVKLYFVTLFREASQVLTLSAMQVISAAENSVTLRALTAVASAWAARDAPLAALFDPLITALPAAPAMHRAPFLTAVLRATPSETGLRALTDAMLTHTERSAAAERAARKSGGSTQGVHTSTPGVATLEGEESEWYLDLLSTVLRGIEVPACIDILAGIVRDDSETLKRATSRRARLAIRFVAAYVRDSGSMVATAATAEAQAALRTLLEAGLAQLHTCYSKADASAKKSTAAAVKGLQDLLEALQSVIQPPHYIAALAQVVQSGGDGVQRLALRLLATACQDLAAGTRELDASSMSAAAGAVAAALPSLTRICTADAAGCAPAVKQAALVAIDAAAGALDVAGSDEQALAALQPVVQPIVSLLQASSVNDPASAPMCASALAAVGRIARVAADALVASVPALLSSTLRMADQVLSALQESADCSPAALQLTAALAALSALLAALPAFLAPSLADIVALVLDPRVAALEDMAAQRAAAAIRTALPAQVEPRLLLPALAQQLDSACARGSAAVSALLQLMHDVVSGMQPSLASQHAEALFAFARSALALRSATQQQVDVATAEPLAVQLLVAIALKLSEARFKPLFLHLVEWAGTVPAHAASASSTEQGAALMARQTTFLRCVAALATTLRSVFTPYFSYVLDMLVDALRQGTAPGAATAAAPAGSKKKKKHKKRKSAEAEAQPSGPPSNTAAWPAAAALRSAAAVVCVHRLCLYDSKGFLTTERFERLLEALLGTLEATAQHHSDTAAAAAAMVDSALASRIALGSRTRLPQVAVAVSAALVQLAMAAPADAQWKRVNHRVCGLNL